MPFPSKLKFSERVNYESGCWVENELKNGNRSKDRKQKIRMAQYSDSGRANEVD